MPTLPEALQTVKDASTTHSPDRFQHAVVLFLGILVAEIEDIRKDVENIEVIEPDPMWE